MLHLARRLAPLSLMPLVAAAGGGSDTYDDAVLALSPYLYWPLDDSSGSTARDLSGNGRTGTYNNGSGSFTLGRTSLVSSSTGTAARFQSAYAISSAILNASTKSMSCVVKFASVTDGARVFGLGEGLNAVTNDYEIGTRAGAHWQFYVYDGASEFLDYATGPSTGNVYHLACTLGPTNGQCIYINGSLVAQASGVTTSFASYANPNVMVGGYVNFSFPNYQADMDVQKVAFYTTELTATQVGSIYNP